MIVRGLPSCKKYAITKPGLVGKVTLTNSEDCDDMFKAIYVYVDGYNLLASITVWAYKQDFEKAVQTVS